MRAAVSCIAVLIAATSAAAHAGEPAWLAEARAREGKLTRAQSVESPDGWFRARVPARLAGRVEFEDDAYSMAFDIGTGTPVNCEVIRGGFDPANLLRATADLTFAELGPLQGRISNKAMERIDAAAAGVVPLLSADWIYTADDGSGAKVGAVKQAAAQKAGHGIYCVHIDLGYSRTFAEIVRSLVETIEMPAAEGFGDAYFVEVATLRLGGMRVGVSSTRLVRDEDGDTRATTASSMLVPAAAGAVHAQDTFSTEWLRPDGSLINQAHVELANGEVESRLGLAQDDDGRWTVEGEHLGKPIDAVIDSPGPPVSSVQQAWQRRLLLADGDPAGRVLTGTAWLSADPTRFSEWRVQVTGAAGRGRFAAKESIAGLAVDTVIDPVTGLPLEFSLPVGPMTLVAERVAVDGGF